ncbi:MAG TPA: MarR family transcriptional regulator [Mycobacterium sp.]|nr:MarR family transcriptional regulator [Mycobacterium sp.]HUH71070.1 MarR family transcriptional regulator [Mycobacterium sp.]
MRTASRRQWVTEQMLQLIAGVVLHNAAVAARLRLGVNDLQVLGLIQLAGRITPGELARQTGLSTGSVTGVTDRLVEAGYAARSRDDHDRRKVYLAADPDGLARINVHYVRQGDHLAAVLARRTTAELKVIGDFLAELNAVEPLIAPVPRHAPEKDAPSSANEPHGTSSIP